MSHRLFRLTLLCQLLVFALHLWMVHRGAVPETALFREFQGFVWRTIPRWRIFIGLHSLVIALTATSIGIVLLAMLRPCGRPLFVLGLASYLIYLRLEPRFQPEDWEFILAVLVAEIGGALTLLAVGVGRDTLASLLRGAVSVIVSFALFRLARGIGPISSFPHTGELSTFVTFFGAGYLVTLAWVGSVAQHFVRSKLNADLEARPTVRGLLIHFVSGVLLVAATVAVIGGEPVWIAVVPFAPLVVAIYAPISWFQATGETVVFSSALAPGIDLALRNRLLLGILFQYLLLVIVWAVVSSLRNPNRRSVAVAHGALLLYWLPALWLCQMIYSYGV